MNLIMIFLFQNPMLLTPKRVNQWKNFRQDYGYISYIAVALHDVILRCIKWFLQSRQIIQGISQNEVSMAVQHIHCFRINNIKIIVELHCLVLAVKYFVICQKDMLICTLQRHIQFFCERRSFYIFYAKLNKQ